MSAGSENAMKKNKKRHPRITVQTAGLQVAPHLNLRAVQDDDSENTESESEQSPMSPPILPFTPSRRSAGERPKTPAFERKELRTASLGGVFISRDAQKQFRIRAALGSFRDRVLSPTLLSPSFALTPTSPFPTSISPFPDSPESQNSLTSMPTPNITVSAPQTDRIELGDIIRGLPSKRPSAPSSERSDSSPDHPTYSLPSLHDLAMRYADNNKNGGPPASAVPRDVQHSNMSWSAPKSPRKGKSVLLDVLQRRNLKL